MGIFDIFKKKQDKELDIVNHLSLKNLKNGYVVDYDMKTWEVKASNMYDWGDGDKSWEWQLVSHDDILYLELESDDEDLWSVSRKIPMNRLDSGISKHIITHGDPPESITLDGETYELDESSGGYFHENNAQDGREMLKWDYLDSSGKRYLGIEQWGESEFEASLGEAAEEYQFSNILAV